MQFRALILLPSYFLSGTPQVGSKNLVVKTSNTLCGSRPPRTAGKEPVEVYYRASGRWVGISWLPGHGGMRARKSSKEDALVGMEGQ